MKTDWIFDFLFNLIFFLCSMSYGVYTERKTVKKLLKRVLTDAALPEGIRNEIERYVR